MHHRYTQEFQITNDLYKPVFTAIEDANLDGDVYIIMRDLLTPIHFDDIDAIHYNKMYTDVRIVIEWIFRSMIKNGILPPSLQSRQRGKDQINLTWASKFLAGDPDVKSNVSIVTDKITFPKIIADIVKNLIYICGSKEHTSEVSKEENLNVKEHLVFVGNTPYLLRSATLQLCDVIIWYAHYLKENPDPMENSTNWVISGPLQ